ncbi:MULTISPECIES: hypothetical protein [Nocardiopsis]|uniref:Cupin 2 conserved barrel domain-containing protein n=1 Tax=Nocardiopsis sinuspersici TaxID=501010 RepID=A0A1V3C7T2_9ACTN|nr:MULTISPECIES: hypothetical protein [Nocardiopsis]OOC56586.1 hypothetical protein NOSIN_24430 [Nocardiopsis sinuspersici]
MPQSTLSSTAVLPTSETVTTRTPGVSPEGIGDVVDAGRRSGYAHLGERRLPTLGRLAAAARGAAALVGPTLWPARRGHWQPAPRAARRHAGGRLRVTAVVLEPNDLVSGSAPRSARARGMEVLYLVSGRAHLITSAPDGQVRSASELAADRVRVVGAAGSSGRSGHFLVNTGDEVAVVVRVTA